MLFPDHPYASAAAGLGLWWYLSKTIRARRANPGQLPYPPGPKGYPIIGSLFDLPLKYAWLVYDDWFKIHGDMIYFEVLGQPFLLLASPQRVQDLFERRSANFSDRPAFTMLRDMMEWDWNFAFMPYGSSWRRYRRAFHQHFNMNQVHKYNDVQTRETRAFLKRLLVTPDGFLHHIRHLFAAVIMKVTYGISVKDADNPYVHDADLAIEGVNEVGTPGRFLVDFFPMMKFIPSWFPGAGWKRWAAYYRTITRRVNRKPFEHVQENMKNGTAVPCVATRMAERFPEEGDPGRAEAEEIARGITATAYIGGADSTLSIVQSFFLAMTLYPEVQKRAQEELDAVLGGRLPEFSDRASLPYINAMVKESLRWHPATPLIPHTTTHDDEYEGYFIPKGTIVIGSAWTILHDPVVFDEPQHFRPERYLKDGKFNPEVRDPSSTFGFGRRMCPGRHLSDSSLFITIASVMAFFDIKPATDEDGQLTNLELKYSSGLLTYPLPFSARITPRSQKVAEMLQDLDLSE